MPARIFMGALLLAVMVGASAIAEQTIDSLLADLNMAPSRQRIRAAIALGELGNRASATVPHLITSLESNDGGLRLEAAIALGRIGAMADQTVPALIALLSDESPIIQHAAIESLRSFGADAREAEPDLKRLIGSTDAHVQVAAASTIIALGLGDEKLSSEAVAALIRRLGTEQSISDEAVFGLIHAGTTAVPPLTTALKDSDLMTTIHATDALAGIGPKASEAVEGLLRVLDVNSQEAQLHAIQALGAIGQKADAVVPVLTKMLRADDAVIRTHAAQTLGHFGRAAAPAVDGLVKALQDPNDFVRLAATASLGSIGPDASAAIPALVSALDDQIGSVTIAAARSLSQIGKPAVPSLIEKLKVPHFQRLVATVLGEIGAQAADAVPELTQLLISGDPQARREVIVALAAIGPAARTAAPELLRILREPTGADRSAAAYALGNIGAKESTDDLKVATRESKDPVLRLACFWALLQLEPTDAEHVREAIPELMDALHSQFPTVRKAAVMTLAKLGPKSSAAVPDLRQLLHDEVFEIRLEGVIALAEIGAGAQHALPDLITLLLDEHEPPAIRQSVAYAIGRIGRKADAAVPALRRMMASQNGNESTVAAWALAQIAPDQENIKLAVPILATSLDRSTRPDVRSETARTLARISLISTESAVTVKDALKGVGDEARRIVEDSLKDLKEQRKNESGRP